MHADLVGVVRAFADAASASLGARLCAVIAYGEAVTMNPPSRRDSIPLLVVAEPVDPHDLAALARPLALARRTWHLDPVFFSREELVTSRDVFPVELLQMQARYEVVAGSDVLADITVEKEDLRMQLEDDLKTKRLWLRQRIVDGVAPDAIVLESFATLPPVLGGLLRLRDERVPPGAEGLLEAAARVFGLDGDLLLALLAASLKRGRTDGETARRWLTGYGAVLDVLVAAVEG